MVIVLSLSGWMIGEGNGVRKIGSSALEPPRWTVIFGGLQVGLGDEVLERVGLGGGQVQHRRDRAGAGDGERRPDGPPAAQPDDDRDALALRERSRREEARTPAA